MPTAFNRSIRSLESDGFRRSIAAIVVAASILAIWVGWFFLASIEVYEVTERGRLEVNHAVHPIQALTTGRIVATHLALNRPVQSEDVVVELDSESQQRRLEEQHARRVSLSAQSEVLQNELRAEEQAAREEVEVGRAALENARARLREARAGENFAAHKAERLRRAHSQNLITELEFLEAKSEAEKQQAAAEAQREELNRLERDEQKKGSERKARIEKLKRDMVRIKGELGIATAEIGRLEHEIDKLRIRAPVAGHIGEVANLRPGSVVREGENLGAVVPRGKIRLVANFLPEAAFGRISPGQPARLRLHGFPWTQYGAISAVVEAVASEIREGTVRVDLALHENPASSIPLQHGLPGTVEIEVERASPAILVLRAAGKLVARPIADSKF
jgi:multidrug resistance efflux pump